MLGAIAGDIIGSIYEWNNIKTKEFPLFSERCLFTDDSVLTIALADSILNEKNYTENLKKYFSFYPDRGYGIGFRDWARSKDTNPYNSWGNGAAMRISPVGFAYSTMDLTLQKAYEFTVVTHNHPEGIKGAQSTAAAIFMARQGDSKEEIKRFLENRFEYELDQQIDDIRPFYVFDTSCQGTVPVAFRAFFESNDFEDALRTAISVGGDSDTIACITGGIAHAFYKKIPPDIVDRIYKTLDTPLQNITKEFVEKFSIKS